MRNKQKAWRLGAWVINGIRDVTGQVKARHDKTAAGVLASGERRRRILQRASSTGGQRFAPCGYTQWPSGINKLRHSSVIGTTVSYWPDPAEFQYALNAAGFDDLNQPAVEGAPA